MSSDGLPEPGRLGIGEQPLGERVGLPGAARSLTGGGARRHLCQSALEAQAGRQP